MNFTHEWTHSFFLIQGAKVKNAKMDNLPLMCNNGNKRSNLHNGFIFEWDYERHNCLNLSLCLYLSYKKENKLLLNPNLNGIWNSHQGYFFSSSEIDGWIKCNQNIRLLSGVESGITFPYLTLIFLQFGNFYFCTLVQINECVHSCVEFYFVFIHQVERQ